MSLAPEPVAEEEAPEPEPEPAPSPPSPVNVFAFPSVEEPEDSSGSDVDDEPGFVKITSADPRAAARAAAILKQVRAIISLYAAAHRLQHDYECYTKLLLKKHRRASLSDLARESRRRDLSAAAITKSAVRPKISRISVIDDQVFIPGTPATTLPALLQEAEKEVEHQTPGRVWAARALFDAPAPRDLFKTPRPAARPSPLASKIAQTPMPMPLPIYNVAGERVWTKEEWRLLDACFTDQRLDVAETIPGAEDGALAPVDMISMEDVVDRFVALLGGKDVLVRWGESWERYVCVCLYEAGADGML